MNLGTAGADIIKSSEGCKLAAYPDPGSGGDPWTIGYGHTGPEVHEGLEWTQAQCDAGFANDVAGRLPGFNQTLGNAPTNQNQFDAMFSLAYNIGLRNFIQSSVLRFHHQGLFREAAGSFALFDKGAGRVLPGLVSRRTRESILYLTPEASK